MAPKSAKFCSGRHRVWKSSRQWVPRVPPPAPKLSQGSPKIRSRAPRRRRGGARGRDFFILLPFCLHFGIILSQTLEEIGLLVARFLSPEPCHVRFASPGTLKMTIIHSSVIKKQSFHPCAKTSKKTPKWLPKWLRNRLNSVPDATGSGRVLASGCQGSHHRLQN